MAVLFVLFLVFKNKIKKFIIDNRKQKKQKAKTDVAEDFVFIPIGLTRSFNISFTIEELGNGHAKIVVTKKV